MIGIWNEEYKEFGTDETAIEVADISRNNIRLLFTAMLANRAKSTDSYTLWFNAENAVCLTFNGNECTEGSLATFTVGYNADKTIDPMREGYYYTDISLEISSDF